MAACRWVLRWSENDLAESPKCLSSVMTLPDGRLSPYCEHHTMWKRNILNRKIDELLRLLDEVQEIPPERRR